MIRITLISVVCVALMACSDETIPTSAVTETGSTSSQVSKSPRIDGNPVPPVFFNALSPDPFVAFRAYPEWVPIIFYREMSCTPHDINFLSTAFDFRSLACPSLVDGFLIWPEKNPDLPQAIQERASDPITIWFVSVADWETLAGDGFIGWDELRSAPSFREGLADFYHGRQNLIGLTYSKDIRGYLTSHAEIGFRMHFVGKLRYLEDGSFVEDVPQLTVEFFDLA